MHKTQVQQIKHIRLVHDKIERQWKSVTVKLKNVLCVNSS